MCGIAGWVSFDRDLRAETPTIDAMTATMTRRGPDAAGTWVDDRVALCHRRLAVIDVEGGVQPMVADTDAGPVVLSYSGEAYNFVELRTELRARGHRFRTASDTEVVLHAYLEWGDGFPAHLNGMFALAVWDGRTERLLLARDRLGVKPLFYFPTRDGVIFGSEPKAILANTLVPARVGLDGLRELFVSRMLQKYTTPGAGVWSGVVDQLPGTTVTVDRDGLMTRHYWRLEARPHEDDAAATVERVDALLHDIVRRQMITDVPLCSLLSGGLDSSTITALASGYAGDAGEKVRSFAVDFVGYSDHFTVDELRTSIGDTTHDAPYAQETAAFLGTLHNRVILDPETLADPATRAATVAARDVPAWFGNRDYSSYLLFKAVRENATVALSGESADEVFGGYPWMADLASLAERRLPWVTGDGTMAGASYLLDMYAPDFAAALDVPATMAERYEAAVAEAPRLGGEGPDDAGYRTLAYLAVTRFVRNLLERKDRMSMASGLEVRVPYCDHRLVEYLFNVPWSLKRFDGREKSVLRGVVRDGALPESVVMRKKSPWPNTQDPRFYEQLRAQLADLAANPAHGVFDIFDHRAVTTLADQPSESATGAQRAAYERVLEVATWVDLRSPQLTP